MIKGVGIDLADAGRVEKMIGRFGERFTRRVFTDGERAYCESVPRVGEAYAARFAAKEAVMKVLGSGWGSGVHFREIEVERAEYGRPGIRLHGGALEKARELGLGALHISITHESGLAMAYALAESVDEERNP